MTIISAMPQNTMNTLRLCAPGAIIGGKKYEAWQANRESVYLQPLKWRTPRHVELRSDLFHENVTDEMRDRIFAVMALAPQHTFQVLTKRPERMLAYLSVPRKDGRLSKDYIFDIFSHPGRFFPRNLRLNNNHLFEWPLPNVWLGVSVEDQNTADARIPLLLQTPAAVRFISAEPLLGDLTLREVWTGMGRGDREYDPAIVFDALGANSFGASIDWVIAGGESGSNARPMNPAWARSLRDQCAAAGVPFFFKQHGEYVAAEDCSATLPVAYEFQDGQKVVFVGKRFAGHLLDGVEHHAFPETTA